MVQSKGTRPDSHLFKMDFTGRRKYSGRSSDLRCVGAAGEMEARRRIGKPAESLEERTGDIAHLGTRGVFRFCFALSIDFRFYFAARDTCRLAKNRVRSRLIR